MVQFFSKRNLEQVRKDLQEIDALQAGVRTRLSATISNYGYKRRWMTCWSPKSSCSESAYAAGR
jgi:hypothetical protein